MSLDIAKCSLGCKILTVENQWIKQLLKYVVFSMFKTNTNQLDKLPKVQTNSEWWKKEKTQRKAPFVFSQSRPREYLHSHSHTVILSSLKRWGLNVPQEIKTSKNTMHSEETTKWKTKTKDLRQTQPLLFLFRIVKSKHVRYGGPHL
jgi:hypothetical protein